MSWFVFVLRPENCNVFTLRQARDEIRSKQKTTWSRWSLSCIHLVTRFFIEFTPFLPCFFLLVFNLIFLCCFPPAVFLCFLPIWQTSSVSDDLIWSRRLGHVGKVSMDSSLVWRFALRSRHREISETRRSPLTIRRTWQEVEWWSEWFKDYRRNNGRKPYKTSKGSRLRKWEHRLPKQEAYRQEQLQEIEESVWAPLDLRWACLKKLLCCNSSRNMFKEPPMKWPQKLT